MVPRMGFTAMMKFAFIKAWENIKGIAYISLYTILVPTVLLSLATFVATMNTTGSTYRNASLPGWYWPVALILYIATIVMSLIYSAASIKFAEGIILSKKTDVAEIVAWARTRIVPILVTGLMMGIALILLAFALIIPAIIFGVLWIFTMQIVVLEEKSGMDALNASYKMVKGRFLKVLLYMFAFSVAVSIIVWVALIPVGIVTAILGAMLSFFGAFGQLLIYIVSLVLTTALSFYLSLVGLVFQTHLYLQWKNEGEKMEKVTEKE